MLSGAQLLLLTMFSTLNVLGPSGQNLDTSAVPLVGYCLAAAAVLCCARMVSLASLPNRRVPKGHRVIRISRKHTGPAPRRA